MNTRNAADAAQQDQDRTAWRKPRGASLCGPDAILAEAQALDDHTRYVAATPVLEGRGLSVANNGPDNDRTPSVEIGNRHYGLSRSAAGALFQRLGISVRHLGESARFDESVSGLVEAACASRYGRRQLERSRLVVDERDEMVHGVVGQAYLHIGHTRLVDGMRLEDGASATVRGTMMRVRDGAPKTFIASGGDRGGPDVLKIQSEGYNSLAGESAFGMGTYIYRTVCRNGLMGLVHSNRFRTEHRGERETLEPAIARILNEADACMEETRRLITELIDVRLTRETVGANTRSCEALATSLDALRSRALATELRTAARDDNAEAATQCLRRIIDETGPKEARAVLQSPFRAGEATGWDLVNLATAAARQIHVDGQREREEAETAAGRLGQVLIAERRALAPH